MNAPESTTLKFDGLPQAHTGYPDMPYLRDAETSLKNTGKP
jgi:hypothetical protein